MSLSAPPCPTLTWMRAGHPCAHAYVDACRAPLRAAMSIRRRAGGLLCQPRENHTHTIQLYSQAPRCQAPARLLTPPPLRGGSGPTDMGQAEAKEIIAQQQERDLNPTQIVDRFGSAGFSKPQLDAGPAVTYGLQTNAQLKRVRPVATPSTLWGECYRPALRCRHFLPVSPSPRHFLGQCPHYGAASGSGRDGVVADAACGYPPNVLLPARQRSVTGPATFISPANLYGRTTGEPGTVDRGLSGIPITGTPFLFFPGRDGGAHFPPPLLLFLWGPCGRAHPQSHRIDSDMQHHLLYTFYTSCCPLIYLRIRCLRRPLCCVGEDGYTLRPAVPRLNSTSQPTPFENFLRGDLYVTSGWVWGGCNNPISAPFLKSEPLGHCPAEQYQKQTNISTGTVLRR